MKHFLLFLLIALSCNFFIVNGQTLPTLSIEDANVLEFVPRTYGISIRLSEISSTPVTFSYYTSDDTAISGVDYVSQSGTITIPAGQTASVIVPTIIDNGYDEPDVQFYVTITNPINATISDAVGIFTIIDDDDPIVPLISVADVTVNEDTGSCNVTISIDQVYYKSVYFQFNCSGGSATCLEDYGGVTAGGQVIIAGQTTYTFTTTIVDDEICEGNEEFYVILSNIHNAIISDGSATITIVDNDPAPVLSIANSASVNEDGSSVGINVSLTGATALDASFSYTTSNGTATAGDDYTAQSGTITIPAGQSSATITIPILDDNIDENNENFTVTISNPTNATIGNGSGIITINDDDNPPTILLDDLTILEQNILTSVPIRLSNASSFPVSFDYSCVNGSAVNGTDFSMQTPGSITISPGLNMGLIPLTIIDDHISGEGKENFYINISNAVNANIVDNTLEMKILDNDFSLPRMPESALNSDLAISEEQIKVYPNPTNGMFNVSIEDISIDTGIILELYNSSYQLLAKREVAQEKTKFDIKNQPNGVYILKVILGEEVITKKIIKE